MQARKHCQKSSQQANTISKRLLLEGCPSLRTSRIWAIWISCWIQKISMSVMITILKIRYIEYCMTVSAPGPFIMELHPEPAKKTAFSAPIFQQSLHLKDLEAEKVPLQVQLLILVNSDQWNNMNRWHMGIRIWIRPKRLLSETKLASHWLRCPLLICRSVLWPKKAKSYCSTLRRRRVWISLNLVLEQHFTIVKKD